MKEPGKAAQERVTISIAEGEVTCATCGRNAQRGDRIKFESTGTMCLGCAKLDHLEYLPAGGTALTRRALKNSSVAAVVFKYSRARKRDERQGVLVEADALAQAKSECELDADRRSDSRKAAATKRARQEAEYARRFEEKVRELYPGCPSDDARKIATHACEKHTSRVGRTAAAKKLEDTPVRSAVIAHIRHTRTDYEECLAGGWDRFDARLHVKGQIEAVLREWSARKEDPPGPPEEEEWSSRRG